MARFLGYYGLSDCDIILHLLRLSKATLIFFQKNSRKQQTRRIDTRVVRIWELLNRDINNIRLILEYSQCCCHLVDPLVEPGREACRASRSHLLLFSEERAS